MRIALDTNRYTDLARGDRHVVELVETADDVFLPFVVVAELRAGFLVGTRGRENERAMRRFLAKPGVDVLYPTEATITSYANVYRQLREQGTPIPTNDVWIAALVIEHDLRLATRDEHFAKLPQIVVV